MRSNSAGRTPARSAYAAVGGAAREPDADGFGILLRNPCQIKGAGVVNAAERPIASPDELVALKRTDIDLVALTVDVSRNRLELLSSPVRKDKKPKTKAGRRTLAIPPHVVPFLRAHLEEHAGAEYVFVGADGQPMRGNTLYQAFVRARQRVGLDHLAFHDLRHTGSTLAAAAGATMADLMKRLGHSTEVQARRYLHVVDGRDREIARALSELAARGNASRLPRIIR